MVHPSGYVELEIRSMRWNQKDSMTHKQDPYGWSDKQQLPTKRKAALDLYGELKKETSLQKVRGMVGLIHHPSLNKAVSENINPDSPGESAAEALKASLRQSVKNSIAHSRFSNHPGDMARKSELEKFIMEDDCPIPAVVGVKMFDMGVRGKIDLVRMDRRTGKAGHRYMTAPPNRAVIVAYPRKKDGKPAMDKPHCLYLKQNQAITTEGSALFKPLPSALSEGVMLGKKSNAKDNRKRALEAYLSECGFHSYAYLTPGCVAHYQNQENWFVRNFDKSEGFKKGRLKDITGVRRTPFVEQVVSLKSLG
jgi:hypothetical protein